MAGREYLQGQPKAARGVSPLRSRSALENIADSRYQIFNRRARITVSAKNCVIAGVMASTFNGFRVAR